MLRNLSTSKDRLPDLPSSRLRRFRRPWLLAILLPLWVFIGFFSSELIVELLVGILANTGVPLNAVNPALFNTILAAIVYGLCLTIVIGGAHFVVKQRIKRDGLGFGRLPEWFDLLMAPAGFAVYILLSAVLLLAATHFLPWFNSNQTQDTGFSQLTQGYQYVLAFITLVIIAPVAEETLFRGYLFGNLRKLLPVWAAILITSALFAALHGAWNVGIDVFALSIVLCLLRVYTGSLWASILLHMIKNGIAFYILFINPALFSTLGT